MESIFKSSLVSQDHPPALRFHRESKVDPGFKTTEDGINTRIAIIQKDVRRTGARMLVGSGAVSDDPLVFFQAESSWVPFDISQWNGNGAGNMTGLKRRRAAHIHNDCRAAIECCLRFLEGHARHIGFRKWNIA